PGATGTLTNTATVAAGAGSIETNAANNAATDIDNQGVGVADLVISKTDGQASYVPGTPITYTVTVTNAGPSNASALNLSDIVPAGITGVSVTCAPTGSATCGTNASSGNTVAFSGASLAAGAGHVVTFTISGTVDPSATGTLTNSAQVTVPAGA